MQDESNAKQRIVSLVRQRYEDAVRSARERHAERVGNRAASDVWERENPDDGVGGFSSNPYRGRADSLATREERAKETLALWKEAYDLAVDTFLEEES